MWAAEGLPKRQEGGWTFSDKTQFCSEKKGIQVVSYAIINIRQTMWIIVIDYTDSLSAGFHYQALIGLMTEGFWNGYIHYVIPRWYFIDNFIQELSLNAL